MVWFAALAYAVGALGLMLRALGVEGEAGLTTGNRVFPISARRGEAVRANDVSAWGRPVSKGDLALLASLAVSAGWCAVAFTRWWPNSPGFALTLLVVTPLFVGLTVIDLCEHRLPDALTGRLAAVVIVGLAITAVTDGTPAPAHRGAVGAVVLGGFYLLLCLSGGGSGMGLGDAKLAPSLGGLTAWVGWEIWTQAAVLAFFAGGLWALVLVARGSGRKARIPFGPFMIGATAVSLITA